MGLLNASTQKGASVITINQICDSDQILVSLSKNETVSLRKNETQWLSPVGWTDQRKVTLLDCRRKGAVTDIYIPAKFAQQIHSGEVLILRCSELDLEKKIIWETSDIEIFDDEVEEPGIKGLATGLFSRLAGPKTDNVDDTKTNTELRAEEARKAARNYKAKMEAAAAAKEEAREKALEAARQAEAAHIAETDRIAEMERATKAFEEAERLKQDELRRVEEERRAEEARLAEESRIREEARQREIAAQKEADRKAALARYEEALNVTRTEKTRLSTALSDSKARSEQNAKNINIQKGVIESRREDLANSEQAAGKRFANYQTSASELDRIKVDLSSLKSQSEKLQSERQALLRRLSQADMDYLQAQKDAEAAIEKAKTCRATLEAMHSEDVDISSKVDVVSEKLSSQSQIAATATEKTEALQAKYEQAHAELQQESCEIEVLEQALSVQAEKGHHLQIETETTRQAIEDSQAREAALREAIAHLESGGAPDDLVDVDIVTPNINDNIGASDFMSGAAPMDGQNITFKDRVIGPIRRSVSRKKYPQISIDVEDVDDEEDAVQVNPAFFLGLDSRDNFEWRHNSGLMALGLVIGGMAIIGGGMALNKSTSPKMEVMLSTSGPEQVAGAVVETEVPNTLTADIADFVSKPQAELKTYELVDVVDPVGPAFEIPDMRPVSDKKANDVTSGIPTPSVKRFALETAEPKQEDLNLTQPKWIKASSVTLNERSPETSVTSIVEPQREAPKEYLELTREVQSRLSALGFYNGVIDGLPSKATDIAIIDFKKLFSIPETSADISAAFMTVLSLTEHQQKTAREKIEQQADLTVPARSVQIVDAVPSDKTYDMVTAIPATPVVTDRLPPVEAGENLQPISGQP